MRLLDTDYTNEQTLLQKTKTTILMLMMLFFIVVFTVFAAVRLVNGNVLGMGLDLLGAVVMTLLYSWLRRRESSYDLLSRLILFVALVVIFTTTYFEHAFARGFAWALTVLILAFYLRDRREGLVWAVLLTGIVSINYFLTNSHVVFLEYLAFVVSIITIAIITYFYEHLKDDAQKHAIQAEEQKFLQSVIDSTNDPIMVIDSDFNVTLRNKAAETHIDWSIVADPDHPKCYEISHHRSTPCDTAQHPCPLKEVMESREYASALHIHPDGSGTDHYVELSASPHFDKQGKLLGIIEIARDITDRINVENQLMAEQGKLVHLANHDTLTNLPNRMQFHDLTFEAIERAKKQLSPFVVMLVDLDHFKAINDSMGHVLGDRLLVEIGDRLRKHCPEKTVIARLGGDEFALLVESVPSVDEVRRRAASILETINAPMTVDDETFYLTCSVGISLYPNDGESPEMLFRNADAAVYKAKERGRNRYSFYKAELTDRALERVKIETQLRQAFEHDELRVYYQPQVDAATGRIIGAEALVRWQHPEKGLISPGHFIKIAEESGLVLALDRWMMRTACEQFSRWRAEGLTLEKISLNASMKNLHQNDFVDFLTGEILRSGCDGRHFEIEVTEGQIMADPKHVVALLETISALDISIAVDDFGTGYSSLAYLKRLPVDKLKIDRSFIQDLPHDDEDIAITRAVIALAKSLRLEVIAEGVETAEQCEFLLAQGCDQLQGYYYGRPMPAEAFERLLV
jgi:diguanylate cyclase (GGDEF)-like protein